jgi:hypothetical protein
LVRKDVAEFEHSCALGDPDAKALVTAISNNDRAAKRDDQPEFFPLPQGDAFDAQTCPKPATTLSRKDWPSAPVGAVVRPVPRDI